MGTHPIFESDFDCLTEMIDRFGEFEKIVGSRDFRTSQYRESLIHLAQLVNDVRKQSRTDNVESDKFNVLCKSTLKELATHNALPLSIGNDSQISHRECINDEVNRTVKSCAQYFRKRQVRRQKFLKSYKPKANAQPLISNEEEAKVELNTEEEAAFLAESLTIKRQFD